jgi:hypothetical protein
MAKACSANVDGTVSTEDLSAGYGGKDTPAAGATFSFAGAVAPSTSTSFTFGAPPAASTSPITFGAPTSNNNPPVTFGAPTGGFTFGAPLPTSATGSSVANGGITFGAPVGTPAAITFGAPSIATTTQSIASSGFGGNKITFGTGTCTASDVASSVNEYEDEGSSVTDKVLPSDAVSLYAPINHTSPRGTVYIIGNGDCGQLGRGEPDEDDDAEAILPTQPKTVINNAIRVAAGGMHCVALCEDGHVLWTWGNNDEGALGRPTGEGSPIPENLPGKVEMPENVRFVSVCAGDSHTIALSEEGDVYGWGHYRDGAGRLAFR